MILRQANSGPVITGNDGDVLTWDADSGQWLPEPGAGGGVQSVTAGAEDAGISVDNTDPQNPVLFNTGVHSCASGTGINVDNTDPRNPVFNATGVQSVGGGTNGVTIDNTDPQNPLVNGVPIESQNNLDTIGATAAPYTFSQAWGGGDRGFGVYVGINIALAPQAPTDIVDVVLSRDGFGQIGPTMSVTGAIASASISTIDAPGAGPTTYTVTATNRTGGNTVTVAANGLGWTIFTL